MASLFSSLLNLIFPPRCPICQAVTNAESICPTCMEASFRLEGADAIKIGTSLSRCVSFGRYQDDLRLSMLRFKFSKHPEYAKAYGIALAELVRFYLPDSYDTISHVPVSPKRLRERGYDQALLLARETAKALGTTAHSLLSKNGENKTQSTLSNPEERLQNVRNIYSVPNPSLVEGKRILLLDDIYTTGATMEEAARTLLAFGAISVIGATVCRR